MAPAPHGIDATLEHGTETRLVRRRVHLSWTEGADKRELAIEDVSQALDALVSVGSARREVSEDGYVLYAFAWTDRPRP